MKRPTTTETRYELKKETNYEQKDACNCGFLPTLQKFMI